MVPSAQGTPAVTRMVSPGGGGSTATPKQTPQDQQLGPAPDSTRVIASNTVRQSQPWRRKANHSRPAMPTMMISEA
jgi:hypothetical protein